MGCRDRLIVPKFSDVEIADTVRRNRLLTMEIEFNRECNFKCIYCYVDKKTAPADELSPDEFRDVITQAGNLGVRTMVILGGEPTLYPHLMEMIRYIRKLEIEVVLFTNGANITASAAGELFAANVTVVLKMNTFEEKLQDVLSGKKGAYQQIRKTLENLKRAGYPGPDKRLGISTIICNQNYDELVKLWRWLRDQDITPYFEMITPQGGAKARESLSLEPDRIEKLFCQLSEVDKEFGYGWVPQPPLVGMECLRHLYSCVVNAHGDVYPCIGVDIPVGNIRERKLDEIIKESEIIKKLRHYKENIKGPCRTCEESSSCYGCRGSAHQLTGDYLASDPLCWKNRNKPKDIARLPTDVEKFVPHRTPMLMVDRLLEVQERTIVDVKITDDMIFVEGHGQVEDVAYLEMMAQAMAAHNGFKSVDKGKLSEGFLIGAKNVKIHGPAGVGDRLKVSLQKIVEYGELGVIRAEIFNNGFLLAEGEIRVWHKPDDSKV